MSITWKRFREAALTCFIITVLFVAVYFFWKHFLYHPCGPNEYNVDFASDPYCP